MSNSEITRFNNDVRANKEMLEEMKAVGNDLDKVIAYANSKGYDITAEELETQVAEDGMLTEEQLNEVAGGLSAVITGIADISAIFVL